MILNKLNIVLSMSGSKNDPFWTVSFRGMLPIRKSF